MRLQKTREYVEQRGWKFTFSEISGLGNLTFEYKGLRYYVWEFLDGEYGAESNVRTTGKLEDFTSDYEEDILTILRQWK